MTIVVFSYHFSCVVCIYYGIFLFYLEFPSMYYFLLVIFLSCNLVLDKQSSFRIFLFTTGIISYLYIPIFFHIKENVKYALYFTLLALSLFSEFVKFLFSFIFTITTYIVLCIKNVKNSLCFTLSAPSF